MTSNLQLQEILKQTVTFDGCIRNFEEIKVRRKASLGLSVFISLSLCGCADKRVKVLEIYDIFMTWPCIFSMLGVHVNCVGKYDICNTIYYTF